MAKYKVTISRDECVSCMACASLCPQVFVMSEEDGKSSIVEEYRAGGNIGEGIVGEDLYECVKSAADSCPVEIISVERIED